VVPSARGNNSGVSISPLASRYSEHEEATYLDAGNSARCVFRVSAEAAGNKQKVSAQVQASCKAQAAKKYSAIHFIKRHNFVNNCVAQHAKASAPKAKSTTTGQAPK
jgi:hypothetical protein